MGLYDRFLSIFTPVNFPATKELAAQNFADAIQVGGLSIAGKVSGTDQAYFGAAGMDPSSLGGKLWALSLSGQDVSVGVWQQGVASGHVGIAGSSSVMRVVNSYNDGTLANGKGLDIDSDGKVGLGVSVPSYLLHLAADSAAKPSTNTWTVSSDERLKENIQIANYDQCYANIKALHLKRWKWRDDIDGVGADKIKDRSKLGFVAQDVEGLFPKSVEKCAQYGLDDCRSLNAEQINMSLYGAVKKLIEKVEALEDEVAALKRSKNG